MEPTPARTDIECGMVYKACWVMFGVAKLS